MQRILQAVLFGWLVLSSAALWAEPHDANDGFFNEKFGDLKAELGNARQAGKTGILLMFEMDDCPFCHRMRTTVLNQPDVQAYYRQHFLIFPIDTRGDTALTDFSGKATTEKVFAEGQRARATPVFIFYGLDGKPLARYTGPTKDAAEFIQLGHYVVDGSYKTQTFPQYKLQHPTP